MRAHLKCELCGPRRAGLLGALVPGSLLLILPKCPLCVAAYVAAFTGIGVSVATVSHIKFALASLCVVSTFYFLAYLSFFRRRVR